MNLKRVRLLKVGKGKIGAVIYWMSRDQRVNDNWALIFAQNLALERKQPLIVIFCLVSNFLNATIRQYDFMLAGLQEVERKLQKYNIPFLLLSGEPDRLIPEFIKSVEAGALVTDFDPIKIKRKWKDDVLGNINIPFYEVDAHNIVPCFYVSPKEEFGAYTIRPKIQKFLPEFLEEFPPVKKLKMPEHSFNFENNWEDVEKNLKIDYSIPKVDAIKPGEDAALESLEIFLLSKIRYYDIDRNNPVKGSQSNLSPYFHFGQLSAQRAALNVERMDIPIEMKNGFLEELIIRRELSDNFCLYNPNYDNFNGFRLWAKKTLSEHRRDEREFIYSKGEFENAETHEDLWNAAQNELVITGKIHGYMRMYWAKKILEWSETPEGALETAVYLNDRYQLDGRDPNGYAGCAWAIGGTHDRAWGERPVFGKIRYMNRNGCKRKFDISAYIEKFSNRKVL
jgi:deoxyribodipyrimidine photo-lyase